MRILFLRSATLAATFIVLGASATAPVSAGQQPAPTAPVAIVENFLMARNMRDFSSAAGWCAPLLALQDSDGSWFVDAPTTSDWLRQIANRYVVDPLSHPAVEGNTVVWTERLSQRGVPFPEALRSSISVPVRAVIQDGKIASLSGPYPQIPFRSRLASGEPGMPEGSMSGPAVHPFTLFAGSALGLALTVLLGNVMGAAISNNLRRVWTWRSSSLPSNQNGWRRPAHCSCTSCRTSSSCGPMAPTGATSRPPSPGA